MSASATGPGREAAVPLHPGSGMVRNVVREVGLGLVTLGLVLLTFVAYQLWGTGFAESHGQSLLHQQFSALHAETTGHGGTRSHQAASTASASRTASGSRATGTGGTSHDPAIGGSTSKSTTSRHPATNRAADGTLAPSPPVGQAVDHIVIPSVGVDNYVVQGVAEKDLTEGPGHYPGTPLPGQAGNAAIAGHRTTYGAPFFQLGRLRDGAWIYITDPAGRTFDYRVLRHTVVNPDDVGVLASSHRALLTLTTCNPPYSATTRLVVVAALVGRPAASLAHSPIATAAASTSSPASTTTTSTTSTTTSPGSSRSRIVGSAAPTLQSLTAGNANARVPAILFGALVVALWVAARILASRRRGWRKAATLAVGVVVAAGPLWLCFGQVVRLLPPTV